MLRGVQVQVLLPAYEKTTGDPVVFLFIINLERVNSFEILFLVFAVSKLRGDYFLRRSYQPLLQPFFCVAINVDLKNGKRREKP